MSRRSGLPSVYFILCRTTGLIKIGTARNVQARLKELQTASPGDLLLLGQIPGCDRDLERALHQRYAPFRKRGEWFIPLADILALCWHFAERPLPPDHPIRWWHDHNACFSSPRLCLHDPETGGDPAPRYQAFVFAFCFGDMPWPVASRLIEQWDIPPVLLEEWDAVTSRKRGLFSPEANSPHSQAGGDSRPSERGFRGSGAEDTP